MYTYSYEEELHSPELLLLTKNPSNQVLWNATLSGRCRGVVIVVSPLLRGFWNIPYLEELNRYGAVLKRGNTTIVGVENIVKQLSS